MVCVCVLFGTLPRVLARAIILDPAALSCDAILWILDTRRVFFADALLAILVYFDTPPLCRDTLPGYVYFDSFLSHSFWGTFYCVGTLL